MSDDLSFLRTHLPSYPGYSDEAARHDTDMRVRAFVGEKVSEALTRLSGQLSPEAVASGERTVMECMFTDQAFLRRIEHAELDEGAVAALEAADRRLIVAATSADCVAPGAFGALVEDIDRSFKARYEPLPATI